MDMLHEALAFGGVSMPNNRDPLVFRSMWVSRLCCVDWPPLHVVDILVMFL